MSDGHVFAGRSYLLVSVVLGTVAAPALLRGAGGNESWIGVQDAAFPEWVQRNVMTVDRGGNVYVTGMSTEWHRLALKRNDHLTIKYDSKGTLQWVARFHSELYTYAGEGILLDGFGNIYVAGYLDREDLVSEEESGYYLIKYSPEGNRLWLRHYSAERTTYGHPRPIIGMDPNSSIYLVGTDRSGEGESFLLLQYSSSGSLLWEERYGYASEVQLRDIAVGSSDDAFRVYITGHYEADDITLQYDQSGRLVWDTPIGGMGVAVDDTGNVYVHSGSSPLSKLDSEGAEVWSVALPNSDWLSCMAVDAAGNVVLGGGRTFGGYATTTKINPHGDTVWALVHSGQEGMSGSHDICAGPFGDLYLSGGYKRHPDYGWVTAKYDSDGTMLWREVFVADPHNTSGEASASRSALAVDGQGNVLVSGQRYGAMELVTIKYGTSSGYVNLSSTPGGTVVRPGEGAFSYPYGSTVELLAAADPQYRFAGWQGDTGSVARPDLPSTTMEVVQSISFLTATFEKEVHLTVASTAGGSVTAPGEGTFTYSGGTRVSLVAHADYGCYFQGWTADQCQIADPASPTTEVVVNEDCTIAAVFWPRVDLDVYPEDNWTPANRPCLWKQPGDLLDVVVSIRNRSFVVQRNVTTQLTLPASMCDPGIPVLVFGRERPGQIAIGELPALVVQGDTMSGVQRTIRVVITCKAGRYEVVFRVRLSSAAHGRLDATAQVTSDGIGLLSKSLSDYMPLGFWDDVDPVFVKTCKTFFVTNRKAIYETFGQLPLGVVNDIGLQRVNSLWSTVYAVAGSRNAAVYCVDNYDRYAPFDPDKNPTLTWGADREQLPYGASPIQADEESLVNGTATTVKSIMKSFYKNPIDVYFGGGTYVLILGDDGIIPFYRVWDTNGVVEKYAGNAPTDLTERDQQNNYFFTDAFYRDYDGSGWKNGVVENIYVGRIVGSTPEDMGRFLLSSKAMHSVSPNVIKCEKWESDGVLSAYHLFSRQLDYRVVNRIGGVSLDWSPSEVGGDGCRSWDFFCLFGLQEEYRRAMDPPTWEGAFRPLFTGAVADVQDFDVFRISCHGSDAGLSTSRGAGNATFFRATDVAGSAGAIRTHFGGFHPFFIFDSCLVGLTDGMVRTMMNVLAGVNVRGMLGSTAVFFSWTGNRFNDLFYKRVFGSDTGRGLTRACREFDDLSKLGRLSRLEMTLYGAPWARIVPPPLRKSKDGPREPERVLEIARKGKGLYSVGIEVEIAGHEVVTMGDGFDLVVVDGFELLLRDEETPVIPVKAVTVDLPKEAQVKTVTGRSLDELSLEALNLPAYSPEDPISEEDGHAARYVPCPQDLGVYPPDPFQYTTVAHDDRTCVVLTVYPVAYATDTGETTLYRRSQFQIEYETERNGLATDLGTTKEQYYPGESIEAYATVLNATSESAEFTLTVEVVNAREEVVGSIEETRQVESGAELTLEAVRPAPDIPGQYTVRLTVADPQQTVSSREEFVTVTSCEIGSFIAPEEIEVGACGNFSVEITNRGAVPTDMAVDFKVYQGAAVADTLPRVTETEMAPGESREVAVNWCPGEEIEPGLLAVQAIVEMNGESIGSELRNVELTGGERFIRGDSNGDKAVNIADAICVTSYLFGALEHPCKTKVGQCFDAADANDDGRVDIADAITILFYLFRQGPLPEPLRECGEDPTTDTLDCRDYQGDC